MSAQLIIVTIIKQKKVELQKKCLQLIELWIKSVKGPKWQHLAQAASKSKLEGLATALTEELQWNGQNELQESVDETRGGKYKIAFITRQMLQASWGASLTTITYVYIVCVISVCYSIVTIATNDINGDWRDSLPWPFLLFYMSNSIICSSPSQFI